jgi:beta-mannosidase
VPDAGQGLKSLCDNWTLQLTPLNAWNVPSDRTSDVPSVAAPVPGTVAEALEKAGLFERSAILDLDDTDAWYFCRLEEPAGAATLCFEGLATLAEFYLNNDLLLTSETMFVSHMIDVNLTGSDDLAICFRGLGPRLRQKPPRARWRPQMIVPASLRTIRTTMLGRMPGWCPTIHAAGPYRPITLLRKSSASFYDVSIRAQLDDDGTGRLAVSLRSDQVLAGQMIRCAGTSVALQAVEPGRYSATLLLKDIAPWWPRTHGTPNVHDVFIETPSGETLRLGRTGFRRIEIDRGVDGDDFSLKINGVPVFCRGAVWTNADIVRLPGARADYEPWLKLAAAANFNMIRIGGTMTYETADFFALCDELGIMVWQDAMLANFDYPVGDDAFVMQVSAEIRDFLTRTAASPSLAVFCGGSEMYQQAAMLGLPLGSWEGPLTEQILPEIVRDMRPDVAYVVNSPSGGPMPFTPNSGVTHYYGVGAYRRPLEDARRANVRFSAESLAFAHVPEAVTLDHHLPVTPVLDPRWKARVPRDQGADWDFEDVRDYYLALLYECDPVLLRQDDPAHYLRLSQAVTGEVIEATFAEWRRAGSTCHGALIFTLQDLLPGPGWGLVDSTGLPKPVWHAVRRAFRPVQIVLSDEGTNGLDLHLINDTALPVDVSLDLTCLRDGKTPVVRGSKDLTLLSRSATKLAATDLFGAFFDTTYAFRFGPPSHSVTVATLKDRAGQCLGQAVHFPLGRKQAIGNPQVDAELTSDASGPCLLLRTDSVAQFVSITCPYFLASDNWFHLVPGSATEIRLQPLTNSDLVPTGTITWLGAKAPLQF